MSVPPPTLQAHLFCSPLHPQWQTYCLHSSRGSLNICWMSEWFIYLSPLVCSAVVTRKLKNMSKEERSQRPATGVIRHPTSHLIHQHHRAWTLKMKTRDYCAAQTPWLPVAGWSPGQLTGEATESWSGRQLFGNVNDARIIANVCLTEAFANKSSCFVCLFVCWMDELAHTIVQEA